VRLLAVVVVAVALAAPATASPAPGWKQLINDSSDGRIDGVYRCATYREALRQLPQDGGVTSPRDEFEQRLRDRRCVAAAVTGAGPQERGDGRNYVADGVAGVLAVVAVILLVRQRRQVQGPRA